jgi:hypothetical protein
MQELEALATLPYNLALLQVLKFRQRARHNKNLL